MHLLPFCECYRVNSSRASSGACCCAFFRVVAIAVVVVTGAAAAKVVTITKELASMSDKRTSKVGPGAISPSPGSNSYVSRSADYKKQYESPCKTPATHAGDEASRLLYALESRRLSPVSGDGGRDETKDTVVAVREVAVTSDEFSASYKHREEALHTDSEIPTPTNPNTLAAQRFHETPAGDGNGGKWVSSWRHTESTAAGTGLPSIGHDSASGDADGVYQEGDVRVRCQHDTKTEAGSASGVQANTAALWGEAASSCDATCGCLFTAQGTEQTGLKPPTAGVNVASDDVLHFLHSAAGQTITQENSVHATLSAPSSKLLEELHSAASEQSGLFPHPAGGVAKAEDFLLSPRARLPLRFPSDYQSFDVQHSTDAPGHGEEASLELPRWSGSNVWQAMRRVRTKLTYFSRNLQTSDKLWDNPIKVLREQVPELLKAVSRFTQLCEADAEAEAVQSQHTNSGYAELAAFSGEVSPAFKLQRERPEMDYPNTATKKSRNVYLMAALNPSQVAPVLADVSTAARDALSEASAFVEVLYERPAEWTLVEALQTLEVRIRSLHGAAGSFKDLLQAVRATVRQLLVECPRLARKAAKKGGILDLSMKVTARLYSSVKYIYVACKKLHDTVVLLLPFLLREADLSPQDDLHFVDCFQSIAYALDTVQLRAVSATLYDEKLANILERDAAAVTYNTLPAAETPESLYAVRPYQREGSLLV